MERDHNKSSPSDDGGRDGDGDGDGDSTPPEAPMASEIVLSSPQETYGRKRSRLEEQGGGSSSEPGGRKGKKKGELTDPPSTNPKCATCGKTFGSWKAVFGHLRSHPERDYRGAFPPPKIWEEMLQQEAVQRHHGQEQGSSTMEVEGLVVGSDVKGATVAMSPPSGRGIGIDLNEPDQDQPYKDGFPFDLNMPAPETESEEDENNES